MPKDLEDSLRHVWGDTFDGSNVSLRLELRDRSLKRQLLKTIEVVLDAQARELERRQVLF